MTKENLKKSITLIGPSCVGKSLTSKQLSKRLNMPVINIDDLIDVIELEQNGFITPSPVQQKQYIEACLQDILNDDSLRENLLDDKYIETEKQLVQDLVDMYNYYRSILGNFKSLYKIIADYKYYSSYFMNSAECIVGLNYLTNKILMKIFRKIDQPIIIDPPASYGWQTSKKISQLSLIRLQNTPLNLDCIECENIMNTILANCQTALLLPGFDYEKRNAFRNCTANNFILKDLNNYFETDVSITTNGLFHDPENEYLQQRKWLDAREVLAKENLKNTYEIDNVCNEIVERLEDLKLFSQIANK